MKRSDCAIVPPFPPCEGLRCGGCPACVRLVRVEGAVTLHGGSSLAPARPSKAARKRERRARMGRR